MNKQKLTQFIIRYFIAFVWIANGLFCKVLNLVPRHETIVATILNTEFSRPLTIIIGISEMIMAAWFLSGFKARLNTYAQIIIVATMNIIEFICVPDLLLWGKFNAFFAFLFISIVYFNHFYFSKKIA